jgi:hypothetical protein
LDEDTDVEEVTDGVKSLVVVTAPALDSAGDRSLGPTDRSLGRSVGPGAVVPKPDMARGY